MHETLPVELLMLVVIPIDAHELLSGTQYTQRYRDEDEKFLGMNENRNVPDRFAPMRMASTTGVTMVTLDAVGKKRSSENIV